ncbi:MULTISPECIES: hypothetical protein [Enterobacter]|jgi:uncharacterized protein (UPF0332 family)|uniref:HEPN domain-containing protein n=1 Tax=Enterobacter wuhouensis TaxID=2529381 RepID=A0A4R0G5L1_9ENTR|nr:MULTISPECIES: hypothetical protein [Enterobacter]ELT9297779.1 hypothetical protein [Enterobacter kobei]HED3852381.1 hypothetical protein [Enterobacter soli]ELC6491445.1 hypothetical protein [Enterobacter hormaechei]MBI8958674.1 hypothetical protein [Enterobacter hormaechei]MBI8992306.1 hypothetical protein [Enterobacter hormaechei]
MPVTSTDFIELAKFCASRKDEIGYRNAVARAYYGAYHHVLPHLKQGPKDNHQGLIDYLTTMAWRDDAEPYPKKTLIGLGIALQSLKDQRIISDYKLEATISELDSQVAIKTAEKLLNRCAEMVKTKAS